MEELKKTTINYPFLEAPVEIYERENGHKIIFAKKPGELFNVSTWVKTGSINEDDKNNGISHFLEHLMFKGTTNHKAGEFDRTLESKGAITNAATSRDSTFYYVTLPVGADGKNFDLALELHADMMLNVAIPEEEMGEIFNLDEPLKGEKRERHVVIEEIRMRLDQPWTLVYNNLNKNLYTSHPYRRDVIGTPEIISQVSRDTVYNYYKKYYTPNNMTTILVGDFDSEKTLEKVLAAFDFKGREIGHNIDFTSDRPPEKTRYSELYSEVNTGFIMYGFLTPKASMLKESIIFEIISIALGEGMSSRLYQNLIEKAESPIFNVVCSDYYQYKDGGNFFIEANFKPEAKPEAMSLIENELKELSTNGITEQELKKAVKKLEARFASNAETVSDISETIGYYSTTCEDLELAGKYLSILKDITVEDVKQIVQKYLNITNSAITVLLPKDYE